MTKKKCGRCQVVLDYSKFAKNKARRDGLQSHCPPINFLAAVRGLPECTRDYVNGEQKGYVKFCLLLFEIGLQIGYRFLKKS